jgi:hypothetical protein
LRAHDLTVPRREAHGITQRPEDVLDDNHTERKAAADQASNPAR